MTSLAFILGVLPLVFATGAGQEARHSVGTAVAGGMLVSTFLNLIFIPVLYVVVQTLRGAGRRARGSAEEPHDTAFLDTLFEARSTLPGLFCRTARPDASGARESERTAGLRARSVVRNGSALVWCRW